MTVGGGGTKVSAAVGVTANNVSGVFYTVPANSYAVVNILVNASGANTMALRINSNGSTAIIPIVTTGGESYPSLNAGITQALPVIYLGPGATLETSNTSGSTVSIVVTGVLFAN